MHTYSKLILTTLTATAILALAISGATARSLSTNERNFELIWNNALTLKTKLSFVASSVGARIECNVTLLGGFTNNTITKTTANNQGTIRHGEIESCTGGTLTIRTETFPWNLRYRSFTGTLPTIRSITTGLINATLLMTPTSLPTCEFATEANEPGVAIIGETTRRGETGLETTGEPENITAEEGNRIRLFGSFGCTLAGELEIGGVGLIRNLPRTAKVTLTLIGEGEPPTLSPSPISFGTLEVESLVRRTVTLTAGSEALTVRSISVRAGNYFAITDPNRCVSARVEARRTCAFRVLFSAPGESGREFSDTVIVETSVRRLEDSVTART